MPTHSSTLAWKIPRTEVPGRLQSMRSQRVWHDWATNTHTHTHSNLNDLKETDKVFSSYNIQRLNFEEIDNLDRPIPSKEIEMVIKNPPSKKKKSSVSDSFTAELN